MPEKKNSKSTRTMCIHLGEDEYDFVHENFAKGQMSREIRGMIAARKESYNGELENLEKEYPEDEAKLLAKKKRIEELKAETKRRDDDLKIKEERTKEAHEKLLDSLKRAYWDPKGIQKAAYRIYADYTGLSVQELMDWVQEQAKRRDEIESE